MRNEPLSSSGSAYIYVFLFVLDPFPKINYLYLLTSQVLDHRPKVGNALLGQGHRTPRGAVTEVMERWWNDDWQENIEQLGEKCALLPLRSP
jgi:hypothetical protein